MSWAIGLLASAAASAIRDRIVDDRERTEHERVDACTMGVVLVGRDDRSRVSIAIDAATGRRGWTHVLFDPCQEHDGERRFVDYTVARGVHWSTLAPYEGRALARVELDVVTASETWGCVRARLGRPFRALPLLAGHDTVGSCVGLIVHCLPWHMQRAMRVYQEGPCLSPNTLARYFGVSP